jgi:hypothetical protein
MRYRTILPDGGAGGYWAVITQGFLATKPQAYFLKKSAASGYKPGST